MTAPLGWALDLDENGRFRLGGQFYSQARIRTQDADPPPVINGGGTRPGVGIGQLVQWRNLAFPTLEGELTDLLPAGWLDDLSFGLGGRLVYDGIYDFGPDGFRRELRSYEASATQPPLGGTQPTPVFRGTRPVEREGSPDKDTAQAARLAAQTIFDPRADFAQQARPQEIYLTIEKGPLFLRLGKQSVRWGESYGQRLLDAINPLDVFFGLPFDEDLDEERIPLWMARAKLRLTEGVGPLSDVLAEGFLVPGSIETQAAPLIPTAGIHPFAPPAGCDAQQQADVDMSTATGGSQQQEGCFDSEGGLTPPGFIRLSIYERLLRKRMENSRYGARFLAVFLRRYWLTLGAYRTFSDTPQPRLHYLDIVDIPIGKLARTVVTEITHPPQVIVGGTLSFAQPRGVPGMVRAEVAYFIDEAALVPVANFGAPGVGSFDTFVPQADFLRWVFGYDAFVPFGWLTGRRGSIPWIRAGDQLTIIAQWFHELRLSGDSPFQKEAARLGLSPEEGKFVVGINQPDGTRTLAPRYQSLGHLTFQSFLMGGTLIPQVTFVGDVGGWGSVLPNVAWRLADGVEVKLSYSAIFGAFFKGGFYRDRDQLGVRITYRLG